MKPGIGCRDHRVVARQIGRDIVHRIIARTGNRPIDVFAIATTVPRKHFGVIWPVMGVNHRREAEVSFHPLSQRDHRTGYCNDQGSYRETPNPVPHAIHLYRILGLKFSETRATGMSARVRHQAARECRQKQSEESGRPRRRSTGQDARCPLDQSQMATYAPSTGVRDATACSCAHGTTRSISLKNFSRRVIRRFWSNSWLEKLSCSAGLGGVFIRKFNERFGPH